MNLEQLLLVLPNQAGGPAGSELAVHQWTALVEQFAAREGRELLLGGAEPLAFPGFWVLARRALKARIPRVTAYLSGSLLEPWVLRELSESGLHLLVALESLDPAPHEAFHGPGSHARAMAALEHFLKQGLGPRLGILATATRLTFDQHLPMLAAWAAGRGLSRLLWTTVPDGAWPSPQLRALRLSPEEKMQVAERMQAAGRTVGSSTYVGPLDTLEDPALPGCSRLLRVGADGEAGWGFGGEGGRLGNVRRMGLSDLLDRSAQAAGD